MAEGVAQGLLLLDQVERAGALQQYHLLPAARADLLRWTEAAAAYRAALALVDNEIERSYLARRLGEVAGKGS